MKYWNRIERFFLCYIGKHAWRPLTAEEVRRLDDRYEGNAYYGTHRCERCWQLGTPDR